MARMKLSPRLLPLLLLLLLALQLLAPYQGWLFVLVPFSGAWLIAWLWAQSLLRSVKLVRELRFGWAQVGDRLEERFTLTNTGIFPALWVEVRDSSTLPGYTANCATGVGGDAENRWITQGDCTRRGVFTLGPTQVQTSDPFGFYRISINYPATANMIVMPPIVPLPDIRVAPGGRVGEGRRRAQTLEQTVNAAGVRDYHPQDSFARIHWRTSAHHDKLLVRQLDSTPSADWWIILDMNASAQVGQGEDSTFEHAIILAASLADHGLQLGRAVGLAAAGDPFIWLPPRGGPAQRWEILRALAPSSPGTHPLFDLLGQAQTSLRNVSSLVVITPTVDGEWIPNLLRLTWCGAAATVLLLDPISFGGTTSARAAAATLTDLDIDHYTITRDLLNRPERRPGREGHWEWQVSPTGRARPLHPERKAIWRMLK